MENFELRGFGEPCSEALVCPIRPTTGENVLGFLVVGVNPRRPFDDDYQSFIQVCRRIKSAPYDILTFIVAFRQTASNISCVSDFTRGRGTKRSYSSRSRCY